MEDEIEFTAEEQEYLANKGAPAPKAETPAPEAPKSVVGDETAKAEETVDGDDTDKKDDVVDSNRPTTVPHARFAKERERRKQAERERQELALERERLTARFAVLQELAADETTEKKPKTALEEPDIDPLEDFPGAIDQMRRRQSELTKSLNEQRERYTQDAQEQALSQRYTQDAISYAQRDPSFKDAYMHLMQSWHNELKAYGYDDAAARNKHILGEEKKLAKWALENGKSPAQVIYDMATVRGFTKQVAQPAAAAASEATDETSVTDKIKTIDKAQKLSGTLSGTSGGAKNDLSIEAILNMSDEEFYEKVHSLPKEKRRKLLGG